MQSWRYNKNILKQVLKKSCLTISLTIMLLKLIFQKKKNIKKITKSNFNLNEWMELSREERQKIDFKEKQEKMIKKNDLLKAIREEYNKMKNSKV